MCLECAVLIPVWRKDNLLLVAKAIESVINQSHQPGKLIIVADGVLSKAQEELIRKTLNKCKFSTIFEILEVQKGAWAARNFGINVANAKYVALLDADDVMHPSRLEIQIAHFRANTNIDVLGSAIVEIEIETEKIIGYRKCPRDHQKILQKLKLNNPLFNSTVTFKRDSVISSGGYKNFPMVEDYELWIRMAQSGAKFSNLPLALVGFHIDEGLYKRRGGKQFLRSELFIKKELRNDIFKNNAINAGVVFILRVVFRFTPWRIRKFIHQLSLDDIEVNSGNKEQFVTESDFMRFPPLEVN